MQSTPAGSNFILPRVVHLPPAIKTKKYNKTEHIDRTLNHAIRIPKAKNCFSVILLSYKT